MAGKKNEQTRYTLSRSQKPIFYAEQRKLFLLLGNGNVHERMGGSLEKCLLDLFGCPARANVSLKMLSEGLALDTRVACSACPYCNGSRGYPLSLILDGEKTASVLRGARSRYSSGLFCLSLLQWQPRVSSFVDPGRRENCKYHEHFPLFLLRQQIRDTGTESLSNPVFVSSHGQERRMIILKEACFFWGGGVRSGLYVKSDSVHICTETVFIFQEILRAKSDSGASKEA
jgi:hypothetical protein